MARGFLSRDQLRSREEFYFPPPLTATTTMKSIPLVLLAMASAAVANTAPTVVIQSAAIRPGTTLMDVVYRVNDPDDAMVKPRALAFVDGVRLFAKILKPVTLALCAHHSACSR
jgi:hypothetical protein